MKGKYFVIFGLLAVVGVLAYVMVRLQQRYLAPKVTEVELLVPEEIEVALPHGILEDRARQADLPFRAGTHEFEAMVLERDRTGEESRTWRRFFVKGVNLGAALPGRYPSEFVATREDYARWLVQMGQAGFNAVRVYTILPPEFYQALARHNFLYSGHPVYLFQGIWAPVPDSVDFFESRYVLERKREARRAVDVVHGRAVLNPRPGHASGTYSADVSGFTIAYIFGREWEPHLVHGNDSLNRKLDSYSGDFFSVPSGSPTEVWLAGMLDFLVRYETAEYAAQHPVAFVNWLPLDPMHHPTEFVGGEHIREYDNDLVTLDAMRIQTTPLNRAGFFAAYHVYPYYPDFVGQEPEYREYQGRTGPDNYAGYLHHLQSQHRGMPLLVAEFGVPSSRGNSHHSSFGWSQGGHTETEQADWNIRQFQDIYDEGCAGGLLFAWLDEWFKHNWLVQEFENPRDRNRFWHNVQDPEQCYGLVKFGPEDVTVDGNPADWTGSPVLTGADDLRRLWLDADPAYLYCRVDFAGPVDLDSVNLVLAIDTHDPKAGDFRLDMLDVETSQGVEFLVHFADTGRAEVLVDKPYELFSNPYWDYRPSYRTEPNSAGVFVSERLLSNRQRVTLDGTVLPEHITAYGKLRFGRSDSTSLGDWFVRDSVLEVRLPWGTLNTTDPSSAMVLQDDPGTPELDAVRTDGFSVAALRYRRDSDRTEISDALPQLRSGRVRFSRRWLWNRWDVPEYRESLKRGYRLIAESLAVLERDPERRGPALAFPEPDSFAARLARFSGDARAAVSITFDDGAFHQYSAGLPILERYGLRAGFGLASGWTDVQAGGAEHADQDGLRVRRIGAVEARTLAQAGHSLAGNGAARRPDLYRLPVDSIVEEFRVSKRDLLRKTGTAIEVLHYPYSNVSAGVERAASESGFWFARTTGDRYNPAAGFDPYRLSAFSAYNDTTPTPAALRNILERGGGRWTILQYRHLFADDSREIQTLRQRGVTNTYRVSPATFNRHARLVRNSGYWVAPVEDVGRYLLQRQEAKLEVRRFAGSALVKVNARPGPGMTPVPLTVSADVPWRWVRVTGSEQDGLYSPYGGRLVVDVLPGAEVLFDGLEALD